MYKFDDVYLGSSVPFRFEIFEDDITEVKISVIKDNEPVVGFTDYNIPFIFKDKICSFTLPSEITNTPGNVVCYISFISTTILKVVGTFQILDLLNSDDPSLLILQQQKVVSIRESEVLVEPDTGFNAMGSVLVKVSGLLNFNNPQMNGLVLILEGLGEEQSYYYVGEPSVNQFNSMDLIDLSVVLFDNLVHYENYPSLELVLDYYRELNCNKVIFHFASKEESSYKEQFYLTEEL